MSTPKRKKRPALEEAGGIQKKPMTNPNLGHTYIAYHSSVEDKENPLKACVEKMATEAPSLRYDAERRVAADEGGFSVLDQLRSLEPRLKEVESHCQKPELHRQSHLNLHQRAICTWVRDALNKDTKHRKEETRRLNEGIIHSGDVRLDAMVATERYKKTL